MREDNTRCVLVSLGRLRCLPFVSTNCNLIPYLEVSEEQVDHEVEELLPLRKVLTRRVVIASANYAILAFLDISFRAIQPLFLSTLGLPSPTIWAHPRGVRRAEWARPVLSLPWDARQMGVEESLHRWDRISPSGICPVPYHQLRRAKGGPLEVRVLPCLTADCCIYRCLSVLR